MDDPREIILGEIEKLPGRKSMKSDSFMVCCPYHDDSTPSCGINLSYDNNVPMGFVHCFGCGAKRSWNAFAEDQNLQTIKKWQSNFRGQAHHHKNRRTSYESQKDLIKKALKTSEAIDWPKHLEWRGYSGELIREMGGQFYNDPYEDEVMLFLPVFVNRKYRGGVRAFLEKKEGRLSYLTTKGNWVKDMGLLGYERCKKIVRTNKYRSLVIVEGPRDLMRLLSNDIPGVAILGTENISLKKMFRVMSISGNIDTIYVMPDNDKAGKRLYQRIKGICEEYIKVRHLKLPRTNDEGERIKIDPDSCDQSIIDKVKEIIQT